MKTPTKKTGKRELGHFLYYLAGCGVGAGTFAGWSKEVVALTMFAAMLLVVFGKQLDQ